MDHNSIAEEWFHYANSDIEAAKFLQSMLPTPMEIICYHCPIMGFKQGILSY